MKIRPYFLFLLVSFFSSSVFANQQYHEAIYTDTLELIQSFEQKNGDDALLEFADKVNDQDSPVSERNLVLKALVDSYYQGWLKDSYMKDAISLIEMDSISLSQHIQFYELIHMLGSDQIVIDDWTLENHVLGEWEQSLLPEDLYSLCLAQKQSHTSLGWLFEKHPQLELDCLARSKEVLIEPPTPKQMRDLAFAPNNIGRFQRGTYEGKPRLFQFCRLSRDYACLILMLNSRNQWVRRSSGKIWSLPVLARSRHERPFNQFGGNTPAGVYTIDGVMPEANKQQIYGKYRRLIMEFIPKSRSEVELKKLVSRSNHNTTWWKETTIARDIGRDLLRIHGTLRRNEDSTTPYYPHYPTLGCVATRETEYDGIDYHDQRDLLDTWMRTQGLAPIYQNETRIRGLMYVIELDNKERAVNLRDLERLGLVKRSGPTRN